MIESEFKSSKKIVEETWTVRRYGYIEEVTEWDDAVKYMVVVADLGRQPFLRKKFASLSGARQFYEKVVGETAIDRSGSR